MAPPSAVGRYYADIMCFSEQLVIEVDGDTHGATAAYDAARTRFIESEGFRVIRVTNTDATTNLEGTLTQISSLREKEGAHAQHGKDEGDRTRKEGAAL
jgi:very-short-patch-repair endonuclease